jgi:hypothetical protein
MKTISKQYLTIFMLIALVLFNACKKEDDSPSGSNNNGSNNTNTNIVLDFFKDNLNDAKQITSVDITNGNYIYGNNYWTYIYISDCSFLDSDGNQVTGIIDFELIEAQTKLDMLKLNKPTFTSDGQLLVSGGILYVNASQNGEDLIINPNCGLEVNMPNYSNNSYDGNMQYFSGDVDLNGVFGWDLEEDDTVITAQDQDTSVFYFQIDSVGWINCDYFNGTGAPLTGVQVELPSGYDGSNSQCFIYYNSINSLAGLYDSDVDGVFDLGSGYESPVGLSVKFIALSGDSVNEYYYHISNNTVTTINHYEPIPNMTGPISHADLQIMFDSNL